MPISGSKVIIFWCKKPTQTPHIEHNWKNQHRDLDFLFYARKAKKQIDIIVIIINNNYLCTQEKEDKKATNIIH